jgi:predicted RNA-binding Zn ribbon-like protein
VVAPSPAPGENRSVALALVNTEIEPAGEHIDLLADAASWMRWLRAHNLPRAAAATIEPADLVRMRALRGAIRASFTAVTDGGRPSKSAQRTLNEAAALSPRVGRLVWNSDGPHVKWISSAEQESIDAALSLLAVDAIQVIAGARSERLRACAAPGCTPAVHTGPRASCVVLGGLRQPRPRRTPLHQGSSQRLKCGAAP